MWSFSKTEKDIQGELQCKCCMVDGLKYDSFELDAVKIHTFKGILAVFTKITLVTWEKVAVQTSVFRNEDTSIMSPDERCFYWLIVSCRDKLWIIFMLGSRHCLGQTCAIWPQRLNVYRRCLVVLVESGYMKPVVGRFVYQTSRSCEI